MREEYLGTYCDQIRSEAVIIRNDDQELSMTQGGVESEAQHILGMEPSYKTDRDALTVFKLNRYSNEAADRSTCMIACEASVPIPSTDR